MWDDIFGVEELAVLCGEDTNETLSTSLGGREKRSSLHLIVSSMSGGRSLVSVGCSDSPKAAVTLQDVGLMFMSFDLSPVPDVDAPLSMMMRSASLLIDVMECSWFATVRSFKSAFDDDGDFLNELFDGFIFFGDFSANGEMAGWTSYGDEFGADDSYAVEELCEPAVGVGDVMSTTFSSSNEVRLR